MRKGIFPLTMIIISFAIGLCLAEVLLHFFAPPWLEQRMNWTNLGGKMAYGTDSGWPVETLNGKFFRFKPGSEFPIKYYEYNNTVHINSIGTRDNHVPDSKKPDLPFIGDSFTFGVGVEDQQTYVSLLAKRLTQFSVINAGIPGSALPNQLDFIRLRHKDFGSPTLYVFSVYLGNDFQDMLKYYGYSRKNQPQKRKANWIGSLSESRFFGKLYLVQLLQIILSRNQDMEKTNLPLWTYHGKQVQPKFLMINDKVEYKETVRDCLDRALSQLEDLSHKLQFRAVFIIIPDKHQLDDKYIRDRAKYFGVAASEIDARYPDTFIGLELSKRKIPFVDLFDCLKGKQDLYYKLDDHFTPAGHKAAAECIYSQVIHFIQQ